MKNTMKTILLVMLPLLALSFFVSCGEKTKEKQTKEVPEEEDTEIAREPKGIITLTEAKKLCTNYEDRRANIIQVYEKTQNSSETAFVPTQFIDFDFKTIKKYLKYVERKAKKAGVKPDSLRIYYGNYGSGGKEPNKNTVFILPTGKINGEYGGFFIGPNGNAELIRHYWPKDKDDDQGADQKSEAGFLPAFSLNPYQEESLILNDGSSGPPPHTDFN